MKIKLNDALLKLIYISVIIAALGQLRYQLTLNGNILSIYKFGIIVAILCSLLYLFIQFSNLTHTKKGVGIFSFAIICYLFYTVVASIAINNNARIHPLSSVMDLLAWPLVLIVFYEYSRKNGIDENFKTISIIGMITIMIFSVPNIRATISGLTRKGGTIFPVYYCITLFPMILLFCSNKVKYSFMVIILIILVASNKRAGTLAMITGIFVYFLINSVISGTYEEKNKRKFQFIGVTILGLIAFYFINENFDLAIIQKFEKLREDAGSNRIYIWQDVLKHFSQSNLFYKMLGHGFHSVYYQVKPLGMARLAHNSYLETLYDYGVIGTTILIIIISYTVSILKRMITEKNQFAPILAYMLVQLAYLSLFSYFFDEANIIMPFAISWGIILGSYSHDKQVNG